ncbi:uncharacterized protein LOC111491135 [Cucurbita maxima]|uniref:Uncharacterized protein LOC111491135 n=1 Tax=Cucurbita maxima TaxID=3661 RepID=A0A6J1K4L6_CUCMA|nr:uncharacterized protein LOC111491135 [Cucurbita maxima]XP_022995671.1 uncharacterized protein LOC111491135 [Cucurbita maxima]
MSLSSWFRRRLLRQIDQFTEGSIPLRKSDGEKEEQFHGVTDGLIEFVKSFTIETFKNFPLQDEGEALCGDQNLSDWQERHAVLVLSKVKEISQLRYKLCPGHLKEHQFWKIYFSLVKSLVVEYELRAIQLDKLRRMALGNEGSSNCTSSYEVEMAETNTASHLAPVGPLTP